MLIWIIVGALVALGQPWPIAFSVAAFGVHPAVGVLAAVAAAIWSGIARRSAVGDLGEGDWLRHVSAAVRAGSTLRQAIASSDPDFVGPLAVRLSRAGAGMADIGTAASHQLPQSGVRFAALCAMSEYSGSSVSSALTACVTAVERASERRRKLKTALAQVRMSAWVVGVGPIALTLAMLGFRGGVPEPGGPIVVVPMVIGYALQIAGLLLVFRISGRVVS